MKRLATVALPEMEKILRDNGIDITRVIDATVHHSPKDSTTEITVTMLALKPSEDQA